MFLQQRPKVWRLPFLWARIAEGLGCVTSSSTLNMHTNTPTHRCQEKDSFTNLRFLYCSVSFSTFMQINEWGEITAWHRDVGSKRELWQLCCFYSNGRKINCCGCWCLACCWGDSGQRECVCIQDFIYSASVCVWLLLWEILLTLVFYGFP